MAPRSELPVILQNGKFRAQLSNLRITDAGLPSILHRAKQQLIELHSKHSSLPIESVTFSDVPLIEVTLNRNLLTNAAMPVIVEFLFSNPHIESFEILGNLLTDAAASFVHDLMTQSKLQRIKVGDNQFTSEGAKMMASGLQRANGAFVQLHVGGNPIGDDGVTALCDACGGSRVEVLGLRDTEMSYKGWSAVARMALRSSHVVEVQLKGNRLSPEAADDLHEIAVNAKAAAPGGKSSLLILSLSGCQITGNILGRIIGFMALHPRLTQLDLSNNPLGDECVDHLLSWLEGGSAGAVRSLNLQRTQLTQDGLRRLIAADKGRSCALSRLRDLDISYNEFGLEGTASVTSLLESCPNMERLMLHRCLLGGSTLPLLCASAATHPSLRDLDFSSNFSDIAGDSWEQVIAQNKKLERLLLTDNGMPSSTTSKLVQCVANCPRNNLKMLQIGGQSKVAPCANSVLPAVHVTLVQCLARNRGDTVKVPAPTAPLAGKQPNMADFASLGLPTYASTFTPNNFAISTNDTNGIVNNIPMFVTAAAKRPAQQFVQMQQVPQQQIRVGQPLQYFPIQQQATAQQQLLHHQIQQHLLQQQFQHQLQQQQQQQSSIQFAPFSQPAGVGMHGNMATYYAAPSTTMGGAIQHQMYPQVLTADGLAQFSPPDFQSMSAAQGSTMMWCPVVDPNSSAQIINISPGASFSQTSW
ncbi:leucine-rich repeat protein, putative [Bodo saltans]|uniref:Leucine-rich repeat protein, putative n=1 Tax=Bodo saltans TaxID=75058 RepID=A0A0S4JAQ7_BODSA|nr:leucine-rich repeat protein, putative [Bodo saltans]|eukprot:CUG86085.1 leucine-rich repeat protein, putative [Bodo saltans]